MTKRQAIDGFRNRLREKSADSNYTNQFLYNVLLEHAKWLIKREISSGRIYKNTSFFQTLSCKDVIETTTVDPCCPIKTNCKIYRTKEKLPEMWLDNDGPVMKMVTSVDNSTSFDVTTVTTWQSKKDDPYQKMSKQKYAFFSEGYLWFPEHIPHKIHILAFWTDDISSKNDCSPVKDCVRYLDTKFMIPDWLEAEMFAKALEQIAGVSKRLVEDENINKNPNIKN
jgi:hypothetical protein